MSPVSRVCLGLCLIIMTGCSAQSSGTPTRPSTGTPAATTPRPTPTIQSGEALTPGGAMLPPGNVTLTMWVIQEFTPSDDDPGGRHLLNQLLAFERSQADVTVDVVEKRLTGPGGIMDYFHTASQVAPDVLPDIAILSSQLLAQAAAEGVLQPLDDLVAPDVITGLYPAAGELARVDGGLVGIPFMIDFEHVVFNTAILTDTIPATWDVVQESGGPYLFPAAEDAPIDAILSHYLAAGGTLYDQSGNPRFQIDPLTEVFRFYQSANAQQVMPAAMLQTHSVSESWNAYLSGNALIAHVDASLFLADRGNLVNTAVAPIPGPERAAPPLVSGWHWVIATPDPSHQRLAAELIDWLMGDENLGVWSYASRWLPATSGALDIWPTDDQYVQFVRDQLQVAVPHPNESYVQLVQPRLTQAVRDVLLGNSSPAAAAAATGP